MISQNSFGVLILPTVTQETLLDTLAWSPAGITTAVPQDCIKLLPKDPASNQPETGCKMIPPLGTLTSLGTTSTMGTYQE